MTPPDFFTAFAQGLRREHEPLMVGLCAVMDALLIAVGVDGQRTAGADAVTAALSRRPGGGGAWRARGC